MQIAATARTRPAVVVSRPASMPPAELNRRNGWSPWYWLFVVQFVLCLWPPFYNRVEPTWIGHLEREQRPRGAAQRRAAAGLFADAGSARAARLLRHRRRPQQAARVRRRLQGV